MALFLTRKKWLHTYYNLMELWLLSSKPKQCLSPHILDETDWVLLHSTLYPVRIGSGGARNRSSQFCRCIGDKHTTMQSASDTWDRSCCAIETMELRTPIQPSSVNTNRTGCFLEVKAPLVWFTKAHLYSPFITCLNSLPERDRPGGKNTW